MSIIPNVSIDGEDSEVPEKSYLTIENIENIDDAVLDPENVINVLKFLRKKNVNKLIIAHLNINSICNKIDALANIALGSIDILVVTETKFDDTFTNARIKINCYGEPLRVDRNGDGGGVLIFIREDVPSKRLFKHILSSDVEVFIGRNISSSLSD